MLFPIIAKMNLRRNLTMLNDKWRNNISFFYVVLVNLKAVAQAL